MAVAWLSPHRLIGSATIIGLAALLAACDGGTPAPQAGPSTASATESVPSAPPTTEPVALPVDTDTFAHVCDGTPVPTAAGHTGPGPHPVLFFTSPFDTDPFAGELLGEPDNWRPVGDKFSFDRGTTQFVGCVTTADGPTAKTCDYGVAGLPPIKDPLDWRDYTITLLDPRTAAQITVVHIRGADTTCASSIGSPSGDADPAPQFSVLTTAQLQQALGPLIN